MNSRNFREIPMKIDQNQNENDKFQQNRKSRNFAKKMKKYKTFEYGAVRRNVYLVDLEKCCKITIWLLS